MGDIYRSILLANTSLLKSPRSCHSSNQSLGESQQQSRDQDIDRVRGRGDTEQLRSRSGSIDTAFSAIWRNTRNDAEELDGSSAASGIRRNSYDALSARKWKEKRKQKGVILKEMRVRQFGSSSLLHGNSSESISATVSPSHSHNGLSEDSLGTDMDNSVTDTPNSTVFSEESVADNMTSHCDATQASPGVPMVNIDGQRASSSVLVGLRPNMSQSQLRESVIMGQEDLENILSGESTSDVDRTTSTDETDLTVSTDETASSGDAAAAAGQTDNVANANSDDTSSTPESESMSSLFLIQIVQVLNFWRTSRCLK